MNVAKYRRGVILHYNFTFGSLGQAQDMIGFQNVIFLDKKGFVMESFFIEV